VFAPETLLAFPGAQSKHAAELDLPSKTEILPWTQFMQSLLDVLALTELQVPALQGAHVAPSFFELNHPAGHNTQGTEELSRDERYVPDVHEMQASLPGEF
jgi:hypothetical protein